MALGRERGEQSKTEEQSASLGVDEETASPPMALDEGADPAETLVAEQAAASSSLSGTEDVISREGQCGGECWECSGDPW